MQNRSIASTLVPLMAVLLMGAREPETGSRISADERYRRGLECELGVGGLPDVAAAGMWYRGAHRLGHAPAAYRLAGLYHRGRFNDLTKEQRRTHIIELYTFAARSGIINAQVALGQFYAQGATDAQEVAAAYYWNRTAAYNGNPIAQARMARMHVTGSGAPQSQFEAVVWYEIFLANEQNEVVRAIINPRTRTLLAQATQLLPLETSELTVETVRQRQTIIADNLLSATQGNDGQDDDQVESGDGG